MPLRKCSCPAQAPRRPLQRRPVGQRKHPPARRAGGAASRRQRGHTRSGGRAPRRVSRSPAAANKYARQAPDTTTARVPRDCAAERERQHVPAVHRLGPRHSDRMASCPPVCAASRGSPPARRGGRHRQGRVPSPRTQRTLRRRGERRGETRLCRTAGATADPTPSCARVQSLLPRARTLAHIISLSFCQIKKKILCACAYRAEAGLPACACACACACSLPHLHTIFYPPLPRRAVAPASAGARGATPPTPARWSLLTPRLARRTSGVGARLPRCAGGRELRARRARAAERAKP